MLPLVLPPLTGWQLVAHATGDYVLQSDWMAAEKTKKSIAALVHCLFYSIPFYIFFKPSWQAMAVIAGSHFLIDRFRLARFVCYFKNFLAPPRTKSATEETSENPEGSYHVKKLRWKIHKWWHPWKECSVTGYSNDRIPYLTIWLLIITDNLMHIVINSFALRYL
jgi:hypothetical protein